MPTGIWWSPNTGRTTRNQQKHIWSFQSYVIMCFFGYVLNDRQNHDHGEWEAAHRVLAIGGIVVTPSWWVDLSLTISD